MARAVLGRWLVAAVAAAALGGCGANYAANSDLPQLGTSGAGGAAGSSSGGSSSGTASSASCGTDSWNNYAAGFFANNCETCHQHTTEFSSEAAVLAKQSTIESYVNQGLMPQGAPLAQADRDRLAAWFGCPDGTPVGSSSGGSSTTTSGTAATTTSGATSGSTGTCSATTWADVQGIFQSYCVSCHNASGSASAYVDLSSQSAATADAANIYTYVNAGLMPKPGSPQLSTTDKSTVLSWAGNPSAQCGSSSSSGSTGTSSSTGGTTTSSSTGGTTGTCSTYTWADVQGIFQSYCVSCHNPSGTAAAYVDLSNQSASTADASNIYSYVNAGLMPKAGSPQLSATDKTTVLGWASNPSGQCGTSSSSGGSSGSSGTTGTTSPAGSLGTVSACVSATWGSAPQQPDGSNMNPGDNCMQCHQVNGSANSSDQLWDFAGTVYTDAAGSAGVQYATITVVDVTGAVATAQSHSSGNFYHAPPWGGSAVQQPLSITITHGSDTQWMLHSAPNGACNSCHTAGGQCTAPGRIHIP